MKNTLGTHLRSLLLLILTISMNVTFHANATSATTVRLSGHIPYNALEQAKHLGNLEDDQTVNITFTLPLRNQEELEQLIENLHNPAHADYRKYLSTEEFIERFAPLQKDYDKIVAFATEQGLTVSNTHANRLLLNLCGSKKTVESTFNLCLHQYELANGRKFHAPDNDPEVPEHIADVIHGIVGLDNHFQAKSYHRQNNTVDSLQKSEASLSFPSGPYGGFSPKDIIAAYDLGGIAENGSGQVIALFELADYLDSDIAQYASYFGLPAPKLKRVLVDGGSHTGIDAEATLDIELVLALAPQSQVYIYEGPNSGQGILDTYNRIATDNIAKQVSTSWGLGENLSNPQTIQAENAIFKQMAAQGQTIYAAAGDSGAFDDYIYNSSKALIVDDPASQPYVVGVGGTNLKVNSASGAYASESVWNNGLGRGAGGGGVSSIWPIPTWQTNLSSTYSKTYRNVPDVALNSDPATGYSIFYNGQWTIYGGTSCAAPLWASFTSLVNQKLAAAQQPSLGFANPIFYSICKSSSYAIDFHDVTSGNNLYYSAGIGYDNASGWGSFNGVNLFASLISASMPTAVPLLHVNLRHPATPPFQKGGTGSYHIKVTNNGTSPTQGPVHLKITLPSSLSFVSFSSFSWSLDNSTLTFTNTGVLQPGKSYPAITLNVAVSADAPNQVVSEATVYGGGSVSSSIINPTVIQ